LFQVKKISDEGTSEPFIARLMLGILELRDRALSSLFRYDGWRGLYWGGERLKKGRSFGQGVEGFLSLLCS